MEKAFREPESQYNQDLVRISTKRKSPLFASGL